MCPTGPSSWCKYQCDAANGTNFYNDSKCSAPVFRKELNPLFTRLSEKSLLERCLKGITQNQNESLNAMLWSKCPKRVFCGKSKLLSCASQAVAQWNEGAAASANILLRCGIEKYGINTVIACQKNNAIRISSAKRKSSSAFQKRRRELRMLRKRKVDTSSYKSGAFSTKRTPDDVTYNNEGVDFCVNKLKITFVDETKIPLLKYGN